MKQNQCFMASVVTSLAGYLLLHISIRVQNFKLYLTSLQMVASLKSQDNKQRYGQAIAETLALVIREGEGSAVYQALERSKFSIIKFLTPAKSVEHQ